jgi:anti-sigma factor RsiW
MKSAAHQYEDKLLEFAYGELPQHEAEAVDAHVRGCNRCSQSLAEIKGVRATMAQLPMQAAPDAGLESLLAYAEQAAARNSKPAPSLWKRFLMPLASVAALATVGVISYRANQEFDTSPASAIADQTLAEKSAREDQKNQNAMAKTEAAQPGGPSAQNQELSADLKVPPVVAAVSPEMPANAPMNEAGENEGAKDGKKKEKPADVGQLDRADDSVALEGKRGDVWSPEPAKAAPQSVSRRNEPKADPAPRPKGNDEQVYRDDYSNAAGRGALAKEVTKAEPPPPPPPPVQAQDKLSYGLGTPTDSQQGARNTVTGGLQDAPQGTVAKPAPVKAPVAQNPAEKEPPALKEEAKKEIESKQAREEERPAPAPVAAAPMPSSSAPSTYSNPSAPQKKTKTGFGVIKPQSIGSSSSYGGPSEDDALEKTDSLRVDQDAKFAERQRAESRNQSLENARVASSRGDRLSEIRLLAQVLQNGATGYERVEALKRICDAYEFLQEPERADPFCDQLLQEFPNTAAAKAVSDRRKRVQRAPAPAPKSTSPARNKADFADEAASPKPADAAQSY